MSLQSETDSNHVFAPCPHFGECGGCRIQDLPYEDQIETKQSDLRQLFSPILKTKILGSLYVKPSPAIWHYRNRMEFSFSSKEGRVVLGLHRRGRYWDLIDLEECHICPASFVRLLSETRRFAAESGLPGYDKTNHTGFWRYLLVRGNRTGDEIVAEIMTSAENQEATDALARHLRDTCPELKGLFWSLVSGVADAANAERTEHLYGDRLIVQHVHNLEIPCGPRTFLQPNLATAEVLYDDLLDSLELRGHETILDLYCGIGVIGALAAGKAGQVTGVEKDPDNVEAGRELIHRNGIDNMRIEGADVAALLDKPERWRDTNIVIVDPPRAGLNKKTLKLLYALGPQRIVYVSCNPRSLKDNIRRFHRESPYRVASLTAYDMFPHTLHVETLCVLDRVA